MIDVIDILPRGAFDPAASRGRLMLDHDMRHRRRIVFTTADGTRIRLNETKAVQLRDGDGLRLTGGDLIVVEAAPEPLLEIHTHDLAELVRIAWHLGNRHLPTQLMGETLRIRYDHVIADMVHGLGGHCHRIAAPFDPEGGAYEGGGGHHHHHDDDHRHHDQHQGHGHA
jgi:urease accessory protein